jgi:NAD(P)-dependent dehydrogenase (short-subunit alcohol dehydrogenase family)
MNLDGKVALITGACGGIGREIAIAASSAGARLILNDVCSQEDAAALIQSLGKPSGTAGYFAADVTDREAVERMFDEASEQFDTPDICIGNAAIVAVSPFLELAARSWHDQLGTNLTGCFHIGQAAARRLIKAGKPGKIIFISSWVQDVPSENIAAYCVAKSGLKMLAKCMALELGRYGITVNLVAPGFVDAGLSGRMFRENPLLRLECQQYIPLGDVMSAADVAAATLFLCSKAADYMTGSTLLADGGNSLFLRGGNT